MKGIIQMNNPLANYQPKEEDVAKCECGGMYFSQASMLAKIPAVVSPTGQVGLANVGAAFMCIQCGKIFDIQNFMAPKTIEEVDVEGDELVKKDPELKSSIIQLASR